VEGGGGGMRDGGGGLKWGGGGGGAARGPGGGGLKWGVSVPVLTPSSHPIAPAPPAPFRCQSVLPTQPAAMAAPAPAKSYRDFGALTDAADVAAR
jgi:hypothetical protein